MKIYKSGRKIKRGGCYCVMNGQGERVDNLLIARGDHLPALARDDYYYLYDKFFKI